MTTYGKKTQGSNVHLQNLTGARYKHIDGSVTTPITVHAGGTRLLRVILNTNGATLTLKDGSQDVVGIIALDAPEGTFNYGVYCDNSLVVVASGAVDATIVYDE